MKNNKIGGVGIHVAGASEVVMNGGVFRNVDNPIVVSDADTVVISGASVKASAASKGYVSGFRLRSGSADCSKLKMSKARIRRRDMKQRFAAFGRSRRR